MLHRFASLLALMGLLLAVHGSAVADNSTVDRQVAAAGKTARKTFKSEAKAASGILSTASNTLLLELRGGQKTLEEVAQGYGGALATYLQTITKAAEDAGETVSDVASQSLLDTGAGEDCTATLSGTGGKLDKFSGAMQKELDKVRKRAIRAVRKFLSTMSKTGGNDPQGRPLALGTFHIEPLVFAFRPAPNAAGSLTQSDHPLRLHMWLCVKIRVVGAVVTVSGTADSKMSGDFDVRLSRNGHIPVGDFLRDGGVAVDGNHRWTVTETLGDPAPSFPSGNRILLFGTEPQDVGAGPDPTRLVQVGVIGVR